MGFGGRRLGERIQGRTRAKITDQNDNVTDVFVLDISSSGVRIEAPSDASIGRFFTLKVSGELFTAEVVWRKGRDLGARFVTAEEMQARTAQTRAAPVPVKRVSLTELRGMARPGRR